MKQNFDKYEKSAELYRILANAKRLAILIILGAGEKSVEGLAQELGIRNTNVSQHLTLLRHTNLVKMRREGTSIYYRLTDQSILKSCDMLFEFVKKHG